MKFLLPFVVLFCSIDTLAQEPSIVKTVGGTTVEPYNNTQDDWENNRWNNTLFYRAKGSTIKLAVTDGTDAGTVVIADLGNGNLINTFPAVDFMYIVTNEVVTAPSFGIKERLWKSDGTTAGTVLIMEFTAHGFSTPGVDAGTDGENERNYSVQGNTMFFTGYDAVNGAEPWVTDGTPAGTHLLKNIKAGAATSYADGYVFLNGYVYFRAAAVATGATLWRTDGTEAGTVEIAVPQLTVWSLTIARVNNKLVFIGNDNNVLGPEPWVSDGTVAGTFMLRDIKAGSAGSNTSNAQNIHLRFNNQYVFFVANNGAGDALWRTDGSISNTIQLTSDGVYTGTNYSGGGFCAIADQAVFFINDNSKLYYTDGTTAATRLVNGSLQNAIFMVLYQGNAWFNSGAAGARELWKSDAAAAGLGIDINPGGESYPYGLFTLNNSLYFFANNGSGVKLMKLTGTTMATGFVFANTVAPGNWNEPANWSGGGVPGAGDTVYVNSGTPVITGIANAAVLNLAEGAGISLANTTDSLIIHAGIHANGNTLTGTGSLVLQGSNSIPVKINGSLSVPKLYIRSNATLENGTLNITGD